MCFGLAGAAERLCSLDRRRAVTARRMRNLAIQLDELGVIDIGTETRWCRPGGSVTAAQCWPEFGGQATGIVESVLSTLYTTR